MQVEEAALRRTVSKNIAAYRKAHKDTQMDLAAKLNYSDKSISKWERGESLPDIYILTRIADLYGITVSNLIGEEEPPKEDRPRFHMFILILSIALTFAVATLIFFLFVVFAIPYRAWLFFIYAIPVSPSCSRASGGACSGRGSPRRCSSGRWACRSICRCPYRIWS